MWDNKQTHKNYRSVYCGSFRVDLRHTGLDTELQAWTEGSE